MDNDTMITIAGSANHSDLGAPGELRPTTTSSIAAIASRAISRSNQYFRGTDAIRLMP